MPAAEKADPRFHAHLLARAGSRQPGSCRRGKLRVTLIAVVLGVCRMQRQQLIGNGEIQGKGTYRKINQL